MLTTGSFLIIALALAWFVQLGLSYYQMRRFYRRIGQLRPRGRVSIGKAGSAWRRRQYAVLVVDKEHRIVHVEEISGWTVLAALKPVAGVAGHSLQDLFDEHIPLPVSPKLRLAMQSAATFLLEADSRKSSMPAESILASSKTPA